MLKVSRVKCCLCAIRTIDTTLTKCSIYDYANLSLAWPDPFSAQGVID